MSFGLHTTYSTRSLQAGVKGYKATWRIGHTWSKGEMEDHIYQVSAPDTVSNQTLCQYLMVILISECSGISYESWSIHYYAGNKYVY